MPKKHLFAFLLSVFLIATFFSLYFMFHNKAALNPSGLIASQERDIFIFALALGLSVIVPSIFLVFFMVWKYRSQNYKAKYTPDWESNLKLQLVLWAIPITVVSVLGFFMLKYTKMLDPYKPIQSSTKPIKIQVIALQWKWLFIYPDYGIASVNYIEFPKKTPMDFELTANAPMNSFWIPALGGQIYAMPGMSTQTHFMAEKVGEYQGSDAEISGKGFAGMRFTAKAVEIKDFDNWISMVKSKNKAFTYSDFQTLSKPSENNPISFYFPVENGLYNKVVKSFYPFYSVNGVGH